MNLSKKIALNTIVQIASKIISTLLGLFAVAIMARHLGQEGFGEYTTIITFISFFAVVADLGLTLVTVQMISVENADQDKILSNLFTLRLVSAVFFLGLAPLFIWLFPYPSVVKTGVVLATLSFLFPALNQVLVGLFQKNLSMSYVSLAEIAGRLILAVGVLMSARLGFGLYGMLYALVISSAVNFLILFVFSKKYAKISINYDWQFWREIVKKTWPIGLTIFLNLIYLRADTVILSLTKSQSQVGIYGAAYKVIDVLITLPFIFAGIVLPIMTAGWRANRENFNQVLQKSFDLMALLALPLVVGAQFISTRIMTLVAGREFAISGAVLRVLILAAGIIFIGTVFSHAVIAIDRQKKIIAAYLFVALTALAGYFIFIPRFSYFGAAWVTVYSELAIACASFFLVWRSTAFRPRLTVAFRAAIASFFMAALLWLARGINLTLLIGLAVLLYFSCLIWFKAITKEQLLEIFSKG